MSRGRLLGPKVFGLNKRLFCPQKTPENPCLMKKKNVLYNSVLKAMQAKIKKLGIKTEKWKIS